MEVRSERTGWRDLGLNDRHRLWGWDCPATDIDFIEYDYGKAVAFIEYKHERAASIQLDNLNHNLRALIDSGNRASLPVFLVRYATDYSWWKVVALNEQGKRHLPNRITFTEVDFVRLLYKLRGRECPSSILESLQTSF